MPSRLLCIAISAMLAACAARPVYVHEEQALKNALTRCEQGACSDAERGLRLHLLGWFYRVEKNYPLAEKYTREAILFREKAFGRGAPAVATSIDNLGVIFSEQEKYSDAYSAHAEACAIYKASGASSFDQAICANNMAWALEFTGRFEGACSLYLDAQRLFLAARVPESASHYQTLKKNMLRCQSKMQRSQATGKAGS